jgi:hypothetical protein
MYRNYFDENIIKSETDKEVIPAVGNDSEDKSVKPFDSNASDYNTFVTHNKAINADTEVLAYPYDEKLVELSDKTKTKETKTTTTIVNGTEEEKKTEVEVYQPRYSLRPIKYENDNKYMPHYGDWPIYETYVVNKASNSSGDTAG